MKPRRLHSETMTSMVISSPRTAGPPPRDVRRLAPPCSRDRSCASSGRGPEPGEFAQEPGRSRRLTDQSRHLDIEQGGELALAPPERGGERPLPARRAEPTERRDRRAGDRRQAPLPARARLADDAARAERRARKR